MLGRARLLHSDTRVIGVYCFNITANSIAHCVSQHSQFFALLKPRILKRITGSDSLFERIFTSLSCGVNHQAPLVHLGYVGTDVCCDSEISLAQVFIQGQEVFRDGRPAKERSRD